MFTNLNKHQNNIYFMGLALQQAKRTLGNTKRNPAVGCIIVKNRHVISAGYTSIYGRPHAEHSAIKNSNENVTDSKMYVTLEPCNHYGQTPPCTKEIIKNKLSEVIYSVEDVDEIVKGKSFKLLKSKNIIVKKGLLKNDITNFYIPYFFNRKNKMPYVTGKIAISKNNLIYSKGTKRITDIHSDKLTHFLRYKNDSLMISYKTLNKDNPKLNCRLEGLSKFSPKRIILDNNLQMKTNSYIFRTATKENTVIFYNNADIAKLLTFKKQGIKLIKSNLVKNKNFDFKQILS